MNQLNPKDLAFLKRLEHWNKSVKGKESLIYKLILILGGVFVVVSIYYTFQNMNDKFILFVTIPGIITGILLIWLFRAGMNRIREKEEISTIIRKLTEQ